MKKKLMVALIGASLLTACVMVPSGRHGRGGEVMVVPFLPSIVVLGPEPYYFQDGYHYHYNSGRWSYARSRSGPWADLPRDHYPKEVRFQGGKHQGDRDRSHDHADPGGPRLGQQLQRAIRAYAIVGARPPPGKRNALLGHNRAGLTRGGLPRKGPEQRND